ncbi:ferredoxin reductase family protein [Marinobacter orientalis]|uniref:Ferredoxin reductase family protein n=1 Tax=Marinobacter orientalis TaxID=1928859 RepID=A0A7Y0R939_9GAMM|nr:ferredoxin reductase family protein [Marinobacter orientalis]NMT62100.1 ferredoxin reductase family protein [Marinobacter orientalis]TGX50821.1 oxidoreductase [Marinobacter orientalis]
MRLKGYPGDVLLLGVFLLPVVVAVPGLPWGGQAWLYSLAELVGVLALSAFLLAGMLSARIPGTDPWFGGLVRVWTIHRWLGFSAFMLVMAHVLLLALATLPFSIGRSIETVFPPLSDWEVWAGWAAFVTMLIFIAPTLDFFGTLHYQHWKRLHLLSAPALVLALIHTLTLSSVAWVWWLLSALALAAIAWRKLLSPWLARKPYVVDEVDTLARDVVELRLRPLGKGIRWQVGQFVYLTPMDRSLAAGYREEHPYTIASAAGDDELRIGIKAVGDATQALVNIKPGAEVRIEGPYGTFFETAGSGPPGSQRKQLWLGGGIGITPFVSGARDRMSGAAAGLDVCLFYLANRPERAYYLDELVRIAEACDTFTVFAHYMNEEGAITRDYLAQHCPDFAEREVYVCGPPGMIDHLQALLRHEGVPANRIHTEAFDFL